jgi:hypothetical protein
MLLGWEALLGGTTWLFSFTFTKKRRHFILNWEGSVRVGGMLTGPVEVRAAWQRLTS